MRCFSAARVLLLLLLRGNWVVSTDLLSKAQALGAEPIAGIDILGITTGFYESIPRLTALLSRAGDLRDIPPCLAPLYSEFVQLGAELATQTAVRTNIKG